MYFPLRVHTHYSLQRALPRPEQLAARLKAAGLPGAAVTDYGSVSGVPSWLKEGEKAGVKPLAGCEFFVVDHPSESAPPGARSSRLAVVARSQAGWSSLVRAVSFSNRPGRHAGRPRLSLEELASFASDWWVLSGVPGSHLADACFTGPEAYLAGSYEEARGMARPDWRESFRSALRRLFSAFGKENVLCEVCFSGAGTLHAGLVAARVARAVGREEGAKLVAVADTHYLDKNDAADLRVVLACGAETTLAGFRSKPPRHAELGRVPYFDGSSFHLPSADEMASLHTRAELEATLEAAEACSAVSTSRPPSMPAFSLPDGVTADARLREMCREGWKRLGLGREKAYVDRVKEELDTLAEFGLAPYFLVVHDFVRHARTVLKAKLGRGRGSAAGSLVSYLIGVTGVDPVRFDLLFSRFINRGRMSKDKVSLPDVDLDFPLSVRPKVIDYCRDKYGPDRVFSMCTFSRVQGRGALKDVLRAHGRCSFAEMNLVTGPIPDEAAIADDLQEMAEDGEQPSIILWALQNRPDQLKEWCRLKEDGSMDGPLWPDFAQAVRLEGTKRSMGKHASGLIISPGPIDDEAPLVYDKSGGGVMVGYDMRDAEEAGLVKFDILGLDALDVIQEAEHIVRTGFCS
jgi:DNA polymerase-3 subunit alpha